MRYLVTAASKHGATAEIADTIARTLAETGSAVTVEKPEAVESVEPYDVVVLGSGVYAGHWLAPAKQFAERHGQALKIRRVYLFSSGPLGDPPVPAGDPADAAPMRELTGAADHRLFGGRIDRSRLGLAERAIVRLVKASDGDGRSWPDIEAWAREIAAETASAGAAR